MRSNIAAWIPGPKASLEVKEAPFPSPGPKDVIVQAAAVAINPLEYKIQDYNPAIAGRAIQYPTVLGADLAGTIVSIGPQVTTRRVGERVIANADGVSLGQPAKSAFQHFVAVPESYTIPVPDAVPFEKAVVLPLACDTAMAGLFVPDRLGLSTAALGDSESRLPPSGSALLVWGGSSSVGCCAIQMAHAAGYDIYTVASQRNYALCLSLGATKVFDHANPDVENSIIVALNGKSMVGALDCISDGDKTIPACARILTATKGRRKVVTVLAPPEAGLVDEAEVQRLSIPALKGCRTYDVVHLWMAKALADGSLQPKPDPIILGDGLDFVQTGLDTVRKGVSAAKVVVALQKANRDI